MALANHPMRLGIDSPHELRAWRDAARDVMIGMEGAPGAQGSGIGQFAGPGDQRGEYTNNPSQFSFAGYPADAYRPYLSLPGEFDRWSVEGKRPDPFDSGERQGGSDFWPGQFSRIHTGVTERSYAGVLQAMRNGRNGVTLGSRLSVRRGTDVEISITITATEYRNGAGILPRLAHVDVIGGPVTGPVADRDSLRAEGTTVWKQLDVSGRTGTFTIKHVVRDVQESCYFRLRGSDGNRHGAGYHGASVDPAGPIRHGNNLGDADPWADTWFYANPVFIDVI